MRTARQLAAPASTVLPARTILVAAGTQPNTVLAREEPDMSVLDGRYFQALDEDGEPVDAGARRQADEVRVLMRREPDGRAVSFFGDLHPSFAGNVVKAMGGAKQGYPVVSRVLARAHADAVAGATRCSSRAQRRSARRRSTRSSG